MNRHFCQIILLTIVLALNARAIPVIYASIPVIRGKVIAIDTTSGPSADGYIIHLDEGNNPKALKEIRKALISKTRYDYRRFQQPRRGQVLLLVQKTGKPLTSVGDVVEVREYRVMGHSQGGHKNGSPQFESFNKVNLAKKKG